MKTISRVLLSCLILIGLLSFTSFTSTDSNSIVGMWNLTSIKATVLTSNNTATSLIKKGIEENPYISVYFDADGTGCYGTAMEGVDELIETPFTYEVMGNKIILYMEIIPEDDRNEEEVVAIHATFDIKDNLLTLLSDETKAYDTESLDEIGVENAELVKVHKVSVKSVYHR